jgi:hypothetical protein
VVHGDFESSLGFDLYFNAQNVEWHPKLSHFEENLHPNFSHPNRLSCLIFEQGRHQSSVQSQDLEGTKAQSIAFVQLGTLAFPQFSRQILLSKSEWEKC